MSSVSSRVKKVLILDDDKDLLRLICRDLIKGNYLPFPVESQEGAINLLSEEKFDYALLDIILGTNSVSDQTIRFLTASSMNQFNSNVSIVVMSAHMEENYAEAIKKKEPRIKATLKKPMSLGSVSHLLNSLQNEKGEGKGEPEKITTIKGTTQHITDEINKVSGGSLKFNNEPWPLKSLPTPQDQETLNMAVLSINGRNDLGETALMIFTRKGEHQIVVNLIKREADPNLKNREGKTALHICTALGDIEMVELLIKNGAKINIRDDSGAEASYYAVKYSHQNILDTLFKADAKKNLRFEGDSYLHIALKNKDTKMFAYLLEQGVDPLVKNNHGNSCLDIIKQKKLKEFLALFQAPK